MPKSIADHHSHKLFATGINIALIIAASALAVMNSVSAMAAVDDQGAGALIAKLKESKLSLVDGIKQAEKQYGLAISAKFELEDGALNLSVYNAKAGRSKDAEHNVLVETAGDATKSPWAPKVEEFADKEHLTRAAMHLTVVETAKFGLAEAVQKLAKKGTVYSITPAIVGNAAVYTVLVAAADGKSSKFTVDVHTGAVSAAK